MAGQNGLLFSKVPRHRSAVYLRIEQSSQLKQEFFIIFQCPLDGEQFMAGGGFAFLEFRQSIGTVGHEGSPQVLAAVQLPGQG